MQMDLQRFVGAQTDHDLVVLASRQHCRLGGRRVAMNGQFENALFGTLTRATVSSTSSHLARSMQLGFKLLW